MLLMCANACMYVVSLSLLGNIYVFLLFVCINVDEFTHYPVGHFITSQMSKATIRDELNTVRFAPDQANRQKV